MATVTAIVSEYGDGTVLVKWPGLGADDDGEPVGYAGYSDRTMQVIGTFGTGSSVGIEGTLAPDQAGFEPLLDPQDNSVISITSASAQKIESIKELRHWIRPKVTGGDGTTNLTVYLMMRREAR